MQASCAWLSETLGKQENDPLPKVLSRHRSPEDNFDLSETLRFIPDKDIPLLAQLVGQALSPTIRFFSGICDEDESDHVTDVDEVERQREAHLSTLRGGIEIVWLYVKDRKKPPTPRFTDVIVDLHDILLSIPANSCQNQISKICEWLWSTSDQRRDAIAPQTLLYLLMRSFGDESRVADEQTKPSRPGGTATNIRRVYAMRKALCVLDLSASDSGSSTIRKLLMRCSSSAPYLRVDEGRKYLAHLLTLEDIQEDIYEALINQLTSVRKTMANMFGTVILLAWKVQRSDWLADKLMNTSERAICAGVEPFASNLKTVLSSFHANKRVTGVDLLLNRIYGPVLYRNLLVANPIVRRNAVTIMADAFPIHDPGALVEDIQRSIDFQCSKLFELLTDPSPIVRRATVQGTCKLLGLYWEIVPPVFAKKMIDFITSKLAFDSSSAQVRLAVFEGLEFLVDNHLTHEMLAVVLPRLSSLIHETVERVRISFLDLLLSVKAKRMRSLRYFDIVSIDELFLRLPRDSPVVATKIMSLLLTSYFPLERKGKSAEEIAASQTRACLSMLSTNREAARYFYKHVNLHVPPGPLCEFAMRMSSAALDAPDSNPEGKKQNAVVRGRRRRRRTQRRRSKDKENDAPNVQNDSSGDEGDSKDKQRIDRTTLLSTVADVLVSITPSLEKEANSRLKTYTEDIFGGDALKPMLTERGNTPLSRAACWRIASCLSPSKVRPIVVLWREQMDTVLEWKRNTPSDCHSFSVLLSSLMLCAMRWKLFSQLNAVFSSWCDAAVSGHRTSRIGSKAPKRSQSRSRGKDSGSGGGPPTVTDHRSSTRSSALFALRACADIITGDEEFREELIHMSSFSPLSQSDSSKPTDLLTPLRRGCVGGIDFIVENHTDLRNEELPSDHLLLRALTSIWKASTNLVAMFSEDARTFEELRGLLEWSSNANLKHMFAMNEEFGLAFCSICLAHCADAVSLGYVNDTDLSHIRTLSDNLLTTLEAADADKVSRPVADMLRIAYQLREQSILRFESETEETPKCSASALKKSARTFLKSGCQLLAECASEDDRQCGNPVRLTLVEAHLSSILVGLSMDEDPNAFDEAFGEYFRNVFADVDAAEDNLLAAYLCNVTVTLASSSHAKKTSAACRIYKSICNSMRGCFDAGAANNSIANFGYFVANSLFTHYSVGRDSTKIIPDDGARSFFETVGVVLETHFPDIDGSDGDAIPHEVTETRKTITALRNITEQDVGRTMPRDLLRNSTALHVDNDNPSMEHSKSESHS